jgi:tRNA dimethylallyltransferase
VSTQPRALFAVLGPTATGKSALGLALAERLDGEIINCDSTAVFRGFDIGTDKLPVADRRGIPHHLIDIVPPEADYNAADFARDASRVVADLHARGKVPILVGGTGFYFRALTRGLFPGPGKDEQIRARLDGLATRYGTERVHRLLGRVDPASAARIQERDRKRIVRALEVFFQTGQPLTAHFARTVPPLGPGVEVVALALRLPTDVLAARLARRVDQQFAQGLLDEIRSNLAAGLPLQARPFTGLVYRQALEHLRGVRDEAATRALIVQENRRYAKRQLIWFRKEPNLIWFDGPGEALDTQARVFAWLAERGLLHH